MTTVKTGLILLTLLFMLGCNNQNSAVEQAAQQAEQQTGQQALAALEEVPEVAELEAQVSMLAENAPKPLPAPIGAGHYQKPGAAVQFVHNYDGQTEADEMELVTLAFTHRYSSGSMRVHLEAQEGLEIADNLSPYSFALAGEQPLKIATSMGATEEGKYYLSIFATVEHSNGQQVSRVFALAVNVGEAVANAKSLVETGMPVEKTETGETIILMPAEETISR